MEDYEEFGLSKNEARVYETLVRHGKLGSGDISRESGVSYSKIYVVLGSLISKGLVVVVPEKTKKFVASNPENLIKLISEKQEKLEKAKEKAKEMKQFYDVKEKNPVILEVGRAGFYKITRELKETEKYDYSIKYTSEYRPEFIAKSQTSIKKGRDIKNLVRYDKETQEDVKKWFKIKKDMRKLDNEGVAMSIQDDESVMLALIKSNVTLLIKDKPFAKIMKKMFLETYKNSEKVE